MASRVHMYKVDMSCEGCANTITNVLNKNKNAGIDDFEVSFEDKLVTVTGKLDSNAIMEIIKKSGKDVTYVGERN